MRERTARDSPGGASKAARDLNGRATQTLPGHLAHGGGLPNSVSVRR